MHAQHFHLCLAGVSSFNDGYIAAIVACKQMWPVSITYAHSVTTCYSHLVAQCTWFRLRHVAPISGIVACSALSSFVHMEEIVASSRSSSCGPLAYWHAMMLCWLLYLTLHLLSATDSVCNRQCDTVSTHLLGVLACHTAVLVTLLKYTYTVSTHLLDMLC
jgi:hypothetical protein